MKNIIVSISLIGSVLFPAFAFAAAPVIPVVEETPAPVIPVVEETPAPVIQGNGNPFLVIQAWGMNALNTPSTPSGSTVLDEGNVPSTCPAWFPFGCSNITRTDYYRGNMITLGRQLKASGISGGLFGYWIAK